MNTLNRRKFLSSSALLATSSLISVTANAACKDPMPAKWDEEVDVIVVGSGFAGLAAAAEAKNANAGNVIVLEKMRAPGGNSVINGGIFAVPGNPAQVKLGIKDSPELLASDMIAAGLGYGYPEKIKAMTEEALPTYEWTVKELGVQYNDKVGHSVPRHVSAIVALEPGGTPFLFPEGQVPTQEKTKVAILGGAAEGVSLQNFKKLTKIPILLIYGDYIPDQPSEAAGPDKWRSELEMARKFVKAVNDHGGHAELIHLPEIGIHGNSHFLMAEKNNQQLAHLIENWLKKNNLAGK